MFEHRHRNERDQKDICCSESFLFVFFLYCTFAMWVPTCSWFFNSYVLSSYSLIIIVRRYQAAKIDELEDNRKVQIVMMGILMPLFLIHTYFGGQQFFAADLKECRTVY